MQQTGLPAGEYASSDDRGNIRGCFERPKHSGDIRKNGAEQLFVVPIIRSDCFNCWRALRPRY
jgi:hypothetical protein